MGSHANAEIDSWLHDGGLVVTASDRAARALQTVFHHRRRAQGLSAWPAPAIQDWTSFAQSAFNARVFDERVLLNPAQEQAIWADIISEETHLATVLESPRIRLANLAMQAHLLLCSYAPRYLLAAARSGWDADAGAFSRWLSAFDDVCRKSKLLSPSRAPLELIPLLQSDQTARPPILLAGFDRLLPMQHALFDAWGKWQEIAPGEPADQIHFYSTTDEQSELTACARWCALQLADEPTRRLLVITPDTSSRRGEIERAFLAETPASSTPAFEFTLGIPLSQVPIARAANLLLRWLDGTLQENELDWLLATGLIATSREETAALQLRMRTLRRKGHARPEWSLESFLRQSLTSAPLPAAWLSRFNETRQRIASAKQRRLSPLTWAELTPMLLTSSGWPGHHTLSSAEYQAWRRWQQATDASASLGFDSRKITWHEYLTHLTRALDDAIFAPESAGTPIQISGPAQSAGIEADAIWFLSATEDAWPVAGATHPFIPFQVQREANMPHAIGQSDWDLAKATTTRLLSSAPTVHFSYAKQNSKTEARPSRLIAQLAGAPQSPPPALVPQRQQAPVTVSFKDASRVPFPPNAILGGSSVLTSQSQCPFKAFATARLGAQGWEPAEPGLTASQRGQFLHAVMRVIWAGPPNGLKSLNDLRAVSDLQLFVANHVHQVLQDKIPSGVRERMPRRYLELEVSRLTRLISEWLAYESTRLPFTVQGIETPATVSIAGLSLDLRLDRIDILNDDSLLVVDYKTGDVTPKEWQLPRPNDVQLPLYAGFALPGTPGGLLFAKLRIGKPEFVGHLTSPRETLKPDLGPTSALAKRKLTSEQMNAWRAEIEKLARNFIAGDAEVSPRQYPEICDRCDLHAVCRIRENREELCLDEESEEVADE